jgi:hypothetical protein
LGNKVLPVAVKHWYLDDLIWLYLHLDLLLLLLVLLEPTNFNWQTIPVLKQVFSILYPSMGILYKKHIPEDMINLSRSLSVPTVEGLVNNQPVGWYANRLKKCIAHWHIIPIFTQIKFSIFHPS